MKSQKDNSEIKVSFYIIFVKKKTKQKNKQTNKNDHHRQTNKQNINININGQQYIIDKYKINK